MDAMIRQIQKTLEEGRPAEIKTGELASKVLQEIRKVQDDLRLKQKDYISH